MSECTLTMARQLGEAAMARHRERPGHQPWSVTVDLSESTLAITLHGALSPAEQVLSSALEGAAQVQELRRQLLASSAQPMRLEDRRVTGVDVHESLSAMEPAFGDVLRVLLRGTMIPVSLLERPTSEERWNAVGAPS